MRDHGSIGLSLGMGSFGGKFHIQLMDHVIRISYMDHLIRITHTDHLILMLIFNY